MELLLALIYVAFCIAIFKIFRIPVNQWSLSTAVLGGIIGISLTLLVMNYNHPFSTNARIYFATSPVLPGVKGRVVEVKVLRTANTLLDAAAITAVRQWQYRPLILNGLPEPFVLTVVLTFDLREDS